MPFDLDGLVRDIDNAWVAEKGDEKRYHLGASIIGKECARDVYYSHRWYHVVKHTGRMLRLFNRGHREEKAVVRWLEMVGATVWETGDDQQPFSVFGGAIGGSGDGRICGLEKYGLQGTGLFENKTYNEKQFKNLLNKGVLSAKREHYVQVQLYLNHFDLPWCLYTAVCKNDDHIRFEIIMRKPEVSDMYMDRAKKIATSSIPPPRISEDPSWYKCKMCDHKRICHEAAEIDVNCRTCNNIELIIDEENNSHEWWCHKFRGPVPRDFQERGCDQWEEGPR